MQFGINKEKVVVRDQADDLTAMSQNQLFPNVGVGIYAYKYISTGRTGSSYIYGGASMPQVLGLNLNYKTNAGDYYLTHLT